MAKMANGYRAAVRYGYVPSQMARILCTTQELWAVLSNLLETGQVLARGQTATPTVV